MKKMLTAIFSQTKRPKMARKVAAMWACRGQSLHWVKACWQRVWRLGEVPSPRIVIFWEKVAVQM